MVRNMLTKKHQIPIEKDQHQSVAWWRYTPTIKPPNQYSFEDLVSYALITSSVDPITFQEVVNRKEKSRGMR